MYKIIKKLKDKKKIKEYSEEGKIFNMAIIMFISFSLLNIFLIFNFMNLLNNVGTI